MKELELDEKCDEQQSHACWQTIKKALDFI